MESSALLIPRLTEVYRVLPANDNEEEGKSFEGPHGTYAKSPLFVAHGGEFSFPWTPEVWTSTATSVYAGATLSLSGFFELLPQPPEVTCDALAREAALAENVMVWEEKSFPRRIEFLKSEGTCSAMKSTCLVMYS